MNDRPPERSWRETQSYRNLVAFLVVAAIVSVLAILYILLLPGTQGALGAVCTVVFLIFAIVAWEYLMKPGYGFLHRGRELEPQEDEAPEDDSSRPP